jgi:hypothetical protein
MVVSVCTVLTRPRCSGSEHSLMSGLHPTIALDDRRRSHVGDNRVAPLSATPET